MEKSKINGIIKTLPHEPGVYKMKNSSAKIIYIGKAKDLKNRVSSYFQEDPARELRIKKMISEIEEVEFIVVKSEIEALLLETNIIKELRPKYNIKMRDDKNFIYIRINTNEDYPKIALVRKKLNDKAIYFGPKTATFKVKNTFRTLKKILPFRHCNLDIKYISGKGESSVKIGNKTIKYPCLDYHIGRCQGPCIGKCTPEQYRTNIEKIIKFFKGDTAALFEDLKSEMKTAAIDQKFEKAAKIRDKMKDIEEITMRQHVSNLPFEEADVMNYIIDNGKIYTNLFQVRESKIIGQENFTFDADSIKQNEYVSPAEIINSFIRFYYEQATEIPKHIIVPEEPEDKETIEKWLLKSSNSNTLKIIVPEKGNNNRLLGLSLLNAKHFANQSKARWMHEQGIDKGLEELKEILHLDKFPKRIECYDVSHIGGTETVGSMIVFIDGIANPNQYRRFKLAQTKPDDYASMKELLTRRLEKLARQSLPKGFMLKKAVKKDSKPILENIKTANLIVGEFDYKNYFVIKKGAKIAGMIGLIKTKDTFHTTGLFVDPKFRGQKLSYFLLSKAIETAKAKRVYIICRKALKEHYEEFGFEEIHHLPEDLHNLKDCTTNCPIEGMIALVYDKNKHTPDKSFNSKPDLILIDGGKGQLQMGTEVLKKLSLKISVASLAKQEEEIFVPWQNDSIRLDLTSGSIQVLQRARDEAHRFAIEYMKNRHGKIATASEIIEIPGIGEKSMQKLFRAFGSLENIKNTPMDKIAEIVGKSSAMKIKQHFQ
ncbi:MAG: excinuclease ABC subunit C, excinuclease ABC subunit C [Candidatus Peregrinibacteria bacterium GW2011_GWC2_39_14]|nr:MAG: excinuclease ABC subunit C, excinuclease ABC subunit C [Candidatus Peregrinibacteria bacterium GW2011_GWC2_39_14]